MKNSVKAQAFLVEKMSKDEMIFVEGGDNSKTITTTTTTTSKEKKKTKTTTTTTMK